MDAETQAILRRHERDIAVLQQQNVALVESIERLERTNRELSDKMDKVLNAMAEARGGWRTLMWIGGAVATVGAAVSAVIQNLLRGFTP